MSKTRTIQREPSPPPAEPHQMSIAFESNGFRGLPATERMKVMMDLANLLMLAAGVAVCHSAKHLEARRHVFQNFGHIFV